MKKTAKFFMALGCMTLASGLVLPTLGNVAYADPTTPSYDITAEGNHKEISIGAIDTDYVIGEDSDPIIIPIVSGCSVKVLDPSNRVVDLEMGALKPTMVGDYRVVYYMTTGEGTNQQSYTLFEKVIKVTISGFYFEFPENTSNIIPSEMSLEISDKIKNQGFDGTITLPMPEVISSKTKEAVKNPGAQRKVVLTKRPEGSNSEIDYTTNKIKPDKEGEYIFTYTYALPDGTIAAQKQFSLNVNNNYNNDYTLSSSFVSPKPDSAVLGVETKLPSVSGTNKETGESVDVYYSISITKGGVDKSSMLSLSGNVFTPTEKGDYVVKYTIKNVFGTEAESFSFTIKDVKDSKKPTVYFGKLEGDEIVDQSHTVPSQFGLKNIVLPAIYATDNSGAATDGTGKEITYKREIYRYTTTTLDKGTIGSENSKKPIILNYDAATFADSANINNYIIFNYADNEKNTEENKAFEAGSYSVSYTAVDSSNNDTTSSYAMKLIDNFVSSTPEIKLETIFDTAVKAGEKITFDKPTATDTNDDRMIVETFYQFTDSTAPGKDDPNWIKITEEDAGKYTIETEGKAGKSLYILVKTTNDEGVTGHVVTEPIEILGIDDTTAPALVAGSIGNVGGISSINDQFSEITLPTITFSDDQPEYLSVVINVFDKDGKQVTVTDKKLEMVSGGVKVSGAKFTASKSGVYTVSYVVTDISGKTFVYSFKTNEVRKAVAESIVKPIFDQSIQTLELGETLTLPIPSVKDGEGNLISDPTYSIEVVEANGEFEPIVLRKFKPTTTGTFIIQYTIENETGAPLKSAEYTIKVENTLAPTITNEFDEHKRIEKGDSLDIPRLTVSTNGVNDVDWSASKIEVMYNGSVYRTIKLDDDSADYNYKFHNDGTYTIKYTAVDTFGNTATKNYVIKVGDTEKPILELDSSIDFSERNVGSKLVIDPSKITIKDNKDLQNNLFKYLKVEVKNDSGDEIQNNFANTDSIEGYEFNLDEVGTYKVTFTLTDEAGNKTSLVKDVVVLAEGAEKEFPTEAVGIILLVLAILILGGVVAYFIITRKKVRTPEQIKKIQEKKDLKKRK